MRYGKACKEQLPGMVPVCCADKNVTGCCPPLQSHGTRYPCVKHQSPRVQNMDPCPHDAVQGRTNDACFLNGTLVYQIKDPRTAKLLAATSGRPCLLLYYAALRRQPGTRTVTDKA